MTRKGLDRFGDFEAMKFSDRMEVMLEFADVRHHHLLESAPHGCNECCRPQP